MTSFAAYRGTDSFVFVCYSHQDSQDVQRELESLHESGINVWYDEGIRPGSEWTDELASAIANCSHFVLMVTPRSVESRHCRDEIQYALKLGKSMVIVYLEPTELPPGLDLVLGAIQAVHRTDADPDQYRRKFLEAVNRPAPEADQSKSVPGHGAPPQYDTTPKSARAARTRLAGVAAVVVALTIAAALYLFNREDRLSPQLESLGPNSIAVLPLEDRGGFQDDPYYPDSISEDLLNRLTDIKALKLASRRSSFGYRTQQQNDLGLVEIGRRLGVSNVLIGYLLRKDDTLRVNLELVDVSSGREVVRWSNNYDDRPLSDMLAIQTDVTRAIAREFISEGLSVEDEYRIARQSTKNPAAYELYLRARTILREPLEDGVSLKRASELFHRALALDGQFVWAQAGLCTADLRAYRLGETLFDPARDSCGPLVGTEGDLFDVNLALGEYYRETGEWSDAAAALEAAVKQVPNSADAKIALARLYAQQAYKSQDELDRVRAEEAYLEAIAAEPDYWYSHHDYANYLSEAGRFDEALQQMKIALSLEPSSVATLTNYAGVLYRIGRTDEAEAAWNRALQLKGNDRWAHEGLAVMYHYEGRFEEAVKHLVAACDIYPDYHRLGGRLSEAYRMLPGREADARNAFSKALALARQYVDANPNDWYTVGHMALYQVYLGRFDEADRLITQMFELNPGAEPMTHYLSGLVAFEEGDVEQTFRELDLALASGFDKEKHFIANEPALAPLRKSQPERYQAMLDRY